MEDSLLLFQPQRHEDNKPRWPGATIGTNPGKAIVVSERGCPFSTSLHPNLKAKSYISLRNDVVLQ